MAAPEPNSGENHLRFNEPKFDSQGAAPDRKQSGVDHKGSIYAKPDADTGDEYGNLVNYINNYYEGPRRKSVVSMEEQAGKKKPWWKVWARKSQTTGGEAGFEVPDDVSFDRIEPPTVCADSTDSYRSGSRPTSNRVSTAQKLRIGVGIPASMSL